MNNSHPLLVLFRSFFLLIFFYIIFGLVVNGLYNSYPYLENPEYAQDSVKELLEESPQMAFLLIVVLAPLIEELMFRTLLVPSHSDLILFLAVWPLFFISAFIPIDVNVVVKLVFMASFLFSVFYIGKHLIREKQTKKMRLFLTRWRIPIWIATSLLFGFVHVTNYVDSYTLDLALFILIVPRIFAGFFCGYVKLKNKSIAYPIMLHALNNGFAFTLLHLGASQ